MHSAQIYSFDISADQRLMVTGSADKTVRLWALPEGKLIRVLRVPIGPGTEGLVVGVAMSPDGKWVATGSWIGSDESNTTGQEADTGQYVQVFESATGRLVRRLGPLPHVIRDLRFDHNGQQLAVGMVVGPGRKSGIAVWNTTNWTLAYRDYAYEENVRGLSFDVRGRLAAASEDGNIRLYRRDGTLQAKKAIPGLPHPYSVAFSPDGTSIAVGNYRSMKISVVAADTLRLLHAPKTEDIEADNAPSDLSEVTWSADGRYLYAAGRVFRGGVYAVIPMG